MRVNTKRLLLASTALVVMIVVTILIVKRQALQAHEKFMDVDRSVELTGTTIQMLENTTHEACEYACTKNAACIAAVIDKSGMCWLKSSVGEQIQNSVNSALRFPCEAYNDYSFKGKGIGLDIGRYTLTNLQEKGYVDKSMKSISVRDGYKITIYDQNGFGGNKMVLETSQPDLNLLIKDERAEPPVKWVNSVSSIVIEKMY